MITFPKEQPIALPWNNISRIYETYYRQGFAVIDGTDIAAEDPLAILAASLNLGELTTTSYNQKHYSGNINSSGYTVIGKVESNDGDLHHKVFHSTDGQELHNDGTYVPLGTINTVMLFCKQPATTGGESILFNLSGAIENLMKNDPSTVAPMLHPRAFINRSTHENLNKEYIGPMLGFCEQRRSMIGLFALGETCRWEEAYAELPELQPVIKKLTEMAQPGSEFFTSLRLEKNQIILMDNYRICHGRTQFKENPENPRQLIRGVYKSIPNVTREAEKALPISAA